MPTVSIDNLSDPLATIVEVSFGNLLGELLDTASRGREATGRPVVPPARLTPTPPSPPSARLQIQSLKNLGLDITRATIGEAGLNPNRFYITDAKARAGPASRGFAAHLARRAHPGDADERQDLLVGAAGGDSSHGAHRTPAGLRRPR